MVVVGLVVLMMTTMMIREEKPADEWCSMFPGYELYMELVREALAELRGAAIEPTTLTKLTVNPTNCPVPLAFSLRHTSTTAAEPSPVLFPLSSAPVSPPVWSGPRGRLCLHKRSQITLPH
jgi:hypothetical protein